MKAVDTNILVRLVAHDNREQVKIAERISAAAVVAALASYAAAGDFADLLHFALASAHEATAFVTFDRAFARPDEGGLALEII